MKTASQPVVAKQTLARSATKGLGYSTLRSSRGVACGAAYAVLPYLWFFVTTPYVRFPVLGAIHLERILLVLLVGVAFLSGSIRMKMPRLMGAFIALFFVQMCSFAFSQYSNYGIAELWLTEYWKLVVLGLIMVWSLSKVEDVRVVLIGLAAISILYQCHSMFDFARGGSYYSYQGIARMTGTWAARGSGAPNGYAMLALFTLPLATLAYRTVKRPFFRLCFGASHLLCLASIVFSGTRGALACVAIYGLLLLNRKNIVRFMVFGSVALVLGAMVTPQSYWRRHTEWLTGDYDTNDRFERTAKSSAEARWKGFVDGIELGLRHPILGVGPGASAIARAGMDGTALGAGNDTDALQLHNLFGQVAAEVGFVGTALFIYIFVGTFARSRRLIKRVHRVATSESEDLVAVGRALMGFGTLYLAYGFFSHSLYHYALIVFVSLSAVFLTAAERKTFHNPVATS